MTFPEILGIAALCVVGAFLCLVGAVLLVQPISAGIEWLIKKLTGEK